MTDATSACPLPRQMIARDVPHPLVGDMQREQLVFRQFDITHCSVYTVVIALNEFDLRRLDHLSHRFETWPADVQAMMNREVEEFGQRQGVKIEAITQAIGGTPKFFMLGLHWRPKA